MVSFEGLDGYDPKHAEGFIRLTGLRLGMNGSLRMPGRVPGRPVAEAPP